MRSNAALAQGSCLVCTCASSQAPDRCVSPFLLQSGQLMIGYMPLPAAPLPAFLHVLCLLLHASTSLLPPKTYILTAEQKQKNNNHGCCPCPTKSLPAEHSLDCGHSFWATLNAQGLQNIDDFLTLTDDDIGDICMNAQGVMIPNPAHNPVNPVAGIPVTIPNPGMLIDHVYNVEKTSSLSLWLPLSGDL